MHTNTHTHTLTHTNIEQKFGIRTVHKRQPTETNNQVVLPPDIVLQLEVSLPLLGIHASEFMTCASVLGNVPLLVDRQRISESLCMLVHLQTCGVSVCRWRSLARGCRARSWQCLGCWGSHHWGKNLTNPQGLQLLTISNTRTYLTIDFLRLQDLSNPQPFSPVRGSRLKFSRLFVLGSAAPANRNSRPRDRESKGRNHQRWDKMRVQLQAHLQQQHITLVWFGMIWYDGHAVF